MIVAPPRPQLSHGPKTRDVDRKGILVGISVGSSANGEVWSDQWNQKPTSSDDPMRGDDLWGCRGVPLGKWVGKGSEIGKGGEGREKGRRRFDLIP